MVGDSVDLRVAAIHASRCRVGTAAAHLALLGALAINHAALAAAGLWPRSRLLGPNWVTLPRHGGESTRVAITIDDGPDPEVTPQVLSQLAEYRATATFFCVGERVERYPDLAKEIVARGHAIENHSQRHRHNFSLLGPIRMSAEISRAQDSISRVTGIAPLFFRAPAGLRQPLDPILRGCTGSRVDAAWFRYCPSQCRCRLLGLHDAVDGTSVALRWYAARAHSGRPVIVEVLPRLLDAVAERNLQPVTLRSALSR